MTLRRVSLALLGLVAALALYVVGAWFGFYGRHEGAGEPTPTPIPAITRAPPIPASTVRFIESSAFVHIS